MSFGATKKRTFRQFGGRENQQENIRANTLVTDQLVFQRNLIGNYRVDGSFVVDGDFSVERGGSNSSSFKARFAGEHVEIDQDTLLFLPGTTVFRPPDYSGDHVLRLVPLLPPPQGMDGVAEMRLFDSSAYTSHLGGTLSLGATFSVVSASDTQLHLRSLRTRCENVLADATDARARVAASATENTAAIFFRDSQLLGNTASIAYVNGTNADRSCLLFDVSGTNPMSVFRVRALFTGGGVTTEEDTELRLLDHADAGALNVRRRASIFAAGPTDTDAELFFVDSTSNSTSRIVMPTRSGATLHMHAGPGAGSAIAMDAEGRVRFGRVAVPGVTLNGAAGSVFGPAARPLETLRAAVVRRVNLSAAQITPPLNAHVLSFATATATATATAMIFTDPVAQSVPGTDPDAKRYKHGMKIVRVDLLPVAASSSSAATTIASAEDAFFDGNENEFGVNIFEFTLHAKPLNVCVDVTPHGANASAPRKYVVGRMYNSPPPSEGGSGGGGGGDIFDDLVFCVVKTDPDFPDKLVLENGNESTLGILPRRDNNQANASVVYSDLDIRPERSLVLVRHSDAVLDGGATFRVCTLFVNIALSTGRTSKAQSVLPWDADTRLFRGETPWRAAFRKIVFSRSDPWAFATLERLPSTTNTGVKDEIVTRLFSLVTANTSSPKFLLIAESSFEVPAAPPSYDETSVGGSDDARMFQSALFQEDVVVATWPDALVTRSEVVRRAQTVSLVGTTLATGAFSNDENSTSWMPVSCSASTSLFWNREWNPATSNFPVFRWATALRTEDHEGDGAKTRLLSLHAEQVDMARVDADGTLQALFFDADSTTSLDKVLPPGNMDDALFLRREASGTWFCVHDLGRVLEFDARKRTSTTAGLFAHSDLCIGRDAVILGGGRTSTDASIPLALRTTEDIQSVEIGNARELQVNTERKEVVVSESVACMAIRASRTDFSDPVRRGWGAEVAHDVARASRLLSADNVRADSKSVLIAGGATGKVSPPQTEPGTAIFLGTIPTDVVVVGATFEQSSDTIAAAAAGVPNSSSLSLSAATTEAQAVFTSAKSTLANVSVTRSLDTEEECAVHVKGALRADKGVSFANGATVVNEAGYIVQWIPTAP